MKTHLQLTVIEWGLLQQLIAIRMLYRRTGKSAAQIARMLQLDEQHVARFLRHPDCPSYNLSDTLTVKAKAVKISSAGQSRPVVRLEAWRHESIRDTIMKSLPKGTHMNFDPLTDLE